MSVIGKAFEKAGEGVKNVFADAVAANNAHRANEEYKNAKDAANGKVHGTLYNVGETIGDTVADTLNIATLGVSRKIGNAFDDKDSKLDYKELKAAKKDKDIDTGSKVKERAAILVNDNLSRLRDGSDLEGIEMQDNVETDEELEC